MPLVDYFSRIFFDIILGENNFLWAPLCTFTGNFSILDYFNSLFILDLNSEFRDFQIVGSESVIQRICFTNSLDYF